MATTKIDGFPQTRRIFNRILKFSCKKIIGSEPFYFKTGAKLIFPTFNFKFLAFSPLRFLFWPPTTLLIMMCSFSIWKELNARFCVNVTIPTLSKSNFNDFPLTPCPLNLIHVHQCYDRRHYVIAVPIPSAPTALRNKMRTLQ